MTRDLPTRIDPRSRTARRRSPWPLAVLIVVASMVAMALPAFGAAGSQPAGASAPQVVPTVAWRQMPDGPQRAGQSIIYDGVNSVFWLYGGLIPGTPDVYFDKLYRKDATDFDSPWVEVSTTGTSPGARAFPAAGFDPVRTRLIFSGGLASTGAPAGDGDTLWYLDVTNLSAPVWTSQTLTGGPSARSHAAGTYLTGHDAFVVSGGFDAAGDALADNHAAVFSSTPAWVTMSGTNFIARGAHALAFDIFGSRLVAYGGASTLADPVAITHTQSLNLSLGVGTTAAWAGVGADGTEKPRAFMAYGFDLSRRLLWVQGGLQDATSVYTDLAALDLSEATPVWVDTGVESDGPMQRVQAGAAFDPSRTMLLVQGGGHDLDSALADTRGARPPGAGGVTSTPTASTTPSGTITGTVTPTATGTGTATGTVLVTLTATPTTTGTISPTVTSGTPSDTPTATSGTPSDTPTATSGTPTDTPTGSASPPTATDTPSATESPTPTATGETDTPTSTVTETPSPTSTAPTGTSTPTTTPTPSGTQGTVSPTPATGTATTPGVTPSTTATLATQTTATGTAQASATPVPTPEPALVEVEMDEYVFRPDPIRIFVGDSIRWTNVGTLQHTTTSGIAGSPEILWDSGLLLPGESFTHTFTDPGRFIYYCSVHPEQMRGTVIVSPRESLSHFLFAPLVYQSDR